MSYHNSLGHQLRRMPPPIKRLVERHVLRLEDEYEVYHVRSIDPATRRCTVYFTGTQLNCQSYWNTHEKKQHLRVRPTGEKVRA